MLVELDVVDEEMRVVANAPAEVRPVGEDSNSNGNGAPGGVRRLVPTGRRQSTTGTSAAYPGQSLSHEAAFGDALPPVGRRGWLRQLIVRPMNGTERRRVPWNEWARKWLRRGACTTINAFQGDQAKTIIYVMPYVTRYDSRESFYVAATRPESRMIFVGNLEDMKVAVERPPPDRPSALAALVVVDCPPRACARLPPVDDEPARLRREEDERGTPLDEPPMYPRL